MIPSTHISAAEFAKAHGFSRCWTAVTRKAFPNAFIKEGEYLYFNPKEVSYQNDELNRLYNKEYYDEIEGLYYQLSETFSDYQLSRELAKRTDRSYNTWYGYFYKFKFKRGDKADEFLKVGGEILKELSLGLDII